MSDKLKLLFVAIVWGSLGLFIKFIPLSNMLTASLRGIIAAIVFIVYGFLKKKFPLQKYDRKTYIILVLLGVCIGVNWYFMFSAYKYTTVGVATMVYYTGPVLVVLFSPIVFKERFESKKIIAIAVSLVGLYLIVPKGDLDVGGYNHFLGFLYAFIGSILYGGAIIFNKLTPHVPGFDKVLIEVSLAGVAMLPFCFRDIPTLFISPAYVIILVLIMGILHTGICYNIYFSALSRVKAQDAVLILYLDPISAVIFSITILRESFTILQVIGSIIVIAATIIAEGGHNGKNAKEIEKIEETEEEIKEIP